MPPPRTHSPVLGSGTSDLTTRHAKPGLVMGFNSRSFNSRIVNLRLARFMRFYLPFVCGFWPSRPRLPMADTMRRGTRATPR